MRLGEYQGKGSLWGLAEGRLPPLPLPTPAWKWSSWVHYRLDSKPEGLWPGIGQRGVAVSVGSCVCVGGVRARAKV